MHRERRHKFVMKGALGASQNMDLVHSARENSSPSRWTAMVLREVQIWCVIKDGKYVARDNFSAS